MKTATLPRVATHRPAVKKRRNRHDELIAVDLFSGFGGLTEGLRRAGIEVIMAANHNEYKVEVHEANHPEAEHWIADLANPDASDYHSAADLPPGDVLTAGVTCTNHSQANTKRAYAQGAGLFELDDPDFEDRVTRSERDRATATCVLQYAGKHHPRAILIECTTELQSWGCAIPGKPKIGDGTTYRWWLNQFGLLGYRHKVLYLNSMFFGVGQSRDRLYIIFLDKRIPFPDVEHRPHTWCARCEDIVEAHQAWKTGVPPSGSVRYGKQYNYRCPRCHHEVIPTFTPSLDALDLSDLGTRIGDRKRRLAPATMARAERCRQRFGEFPAVLMPVKSQRGSERHPWQPMATQTSQQETALLSTGAIMQMANSFEHPGSECRTRDVSQPLWTQPATNSVGVITPPVALTGQVLVAHRHNGDGKHITAPMDTVTSTHEKAVLLAIDNFQGAPRGAADALPTQGGSETLALISTGVLPYRKNTTPATHAEAMPTVTAEQTPGVLTAAGRIQCNGSITAWRDSLSEIALEDCFFRMMFAHEIGRGCGFDVTHGDHVGSFKVWGKPRDQVDGYGNAVTPSVGNWLGDLIRLALHGQERAA